MSQWVTVTDKQLLVTANEGVVLMNVRGQHREFTGKVEVQTLAEPAFGGASSWTGHDVEDATAGAIRPGDGE